MKLGIIIDWKNEADWQEAAANGLHAVEFCINVGLPPQELFDNLDTIKARMEKYDISVGSIGRWGPDKFHENGVILPEAWADDTRLVELCEALGCPVFNTGVNALRDNDDAADCANAILYLSKLVEFGKAHGVKIATYNCNWNNFVREPRAWTKIHTQIPELGIKYDCSHCINEGSGDYLAEIADWGDRFYHFHVKGTLNFRNDHIDDPPAGLDMVNWHAVMGLLYAKHYDGMLSIEPHSGTWRDDLGHWGIAYTVSYIRPMIYKEDN